MRSVAYFTALSLSYGGVIISVALYILSKRVGDGRRDRVGDGRQRQGWRGSAETRLARVD